MKKLIVLFISILISGCDSFVSRGGIEYYCGASDSCNKVEPVRTCVNRDKDEI